MARSARWRRSSTARSASSPTFRVRSCASALSTDKEARIKAGQLFTFDTDPAPGDATRVYLGHPEIFSAVKPGDNLLVNDGRLRVEITDVKPDRMVTTVVFGGTLSDQKGLNLPDTILPIPALTDKDRADLDLAAHIGVDWIALSFVQRPDDVAEARKLIAGRAGVMAKIEKPSAVNALQEILEISDGIMVARGDLGVELPLETVPARQKQITRAARRAGRPVVVATQMLESMIIEPVPTRAEVSDVATAVYEGADAIMLSAESATGKWPDKAVATMDAIARSVENDAFYRGIITAQRKRTRADERRRDIGRRPTGCRNPQSLGHRLLHGLGFHRHSRVARAPGCADHRAHADHGHQPPPCPCLGPALRA